ncbi:receptor-like protein 8 isoform X2 [Triticum dicoccoides]|uniref:receptor-like protein 8 isoform X2 n=1 Tax=Triticum dicoccoides TaxID=85692 RepID=UPI000E7B3319|nr:receptor-like protein 8 isoform X2 [Triticum dicoccoides]
MSRHCTPWMAAAVLCLVTMSGAPFLPRCEGCRHDERTALLDIHSELEYFNWVYSDWSSTDDCCRWEGVTCNSRTGRVTALDISKPESRIYSGLLNATMFLPLQELRNLSLSNLGIEGCVPGTVAVSSLRSVFLSGNGFGYDHSNQILRKLSAMKLNTLDLSSNFIHDTLSTDICIMGNIQELHLSDNNFVGELPSCMRNLTSLRILDLSNNRLTVKFPSVIFESLTSLVKLSLANNHLQGVLLLSSLPSHNQLTDLKLASYDGHFQVQTENPITNMSSRLQVLVLRNCNLNGNSAILPSFLLNQHGLILIDMSNNSLSGHFPTWLVENNANLAYLNLGGNSFEGSFLPSKVHINLLWLDASCNGMRKLPMGINTTLPNLQKLNLSGTSLQGVFPLVFGFMHSLVSLDLSNNNLLDNIGAAFDGSMSNISTLILSGNIFYGPLPQDIQLPFISYLVLKDNKISGEIPQNICGSMQLTVFDAGNNELSGPLPTCIDSLSELNILNLRGNSLVGMIPFGLCNLKYLLFLDISRNNLTGPVYCLPDAAHVHISENQLNGTFPVPLTLGNSTATHTMDLRENQFSGLLPNLIGMFFPQLKVLLLQGNMFEGTVPNDICNSRYLRLLDLSHNKLSGQLPLCLSSMGLDDQNLPFDYGIFNGQVSGTTLAQYRILSAQYYAEYSWEQDQEEFMTKRRHNYYKGGILNYMSGLDFSSNELNGSIPESLGSMKWLRSLNFSNNYLDGSIPKSFSNLSNLESLDLSHNNLTGQMPQELVALQSLAVFSVAYNNLSGPTPGTKGQFSTFDESSFEGNPYLCGPPFLESCSRARSISEGHNDDGVDNIIMFGCSTLFYLVGFWTSLGLLYFKRSWRWSWFLAVDRFGDFVMVTLAMFKGSNRVLQDA